MILSSVDLPEPFAPTSPYRFPGVSLCLLLLLSLVVAGCRPEVVAPTRAVAAATVTTVATAIPTEPGTATASAAATATATATASETATAAASPTPTATPLSTPSPTVTTAAATPTAVGLCEIVAEEAVTVYQRPGLEAGVFGILDQAVRPQAQARTPDGAWVGFDPAVAQAANIGVFRLRWVEVESVRLEGNCAGLEVVEGPPAGVCFTMPMLDTTVYASPTPDATVVTTLTPGDYAAVTGRYGQEWARIDLDQGNVAAEGEGWVEATTLNLNGPCELPEVAP